MKSICIKTNNQDVLTYISNEVQCLQSEDISYSKNKFVHYNNIIIHFTGEDNYLFIQSISNILSLSLIDKFEENLFLDLINIHYPYFNQEEINSILSNCFSVLADDFNELFAKKFNILKETFSNFLLLNKTIYLDGFINFRLKEYLNVLDQILCEAISIFLVEKEYTDFVTLLKSYILNETPTCTTIHMMYLSRNSFISTTGS